jgi:hypothetical protein
MQPPAGQSAIQAVVRHLAPDLPAASTAEAASALLNLCYEAQSVQLLLQTPGPRLLVQHLQHGDAAVQANSAGAIQSISYQVSRCVHPRWVVTVTQNSRSPPTAVQQACRQQLEVALHFLLASSGVFCG